MKHPIQPIEEDENGTPRFKENKIVSALLDHSSKNGMNLNDIAAMDFSIDDRDQFTQLIGYSHSAAPISSDVWDIADAMQKSGLSEKDARIKYLEEKLKEVTKGVRSAAIALFDIHPDDL